MDDQDLRAWVCAWASKYDIAYDTKIEKFAGRAALTRTEIDEILVWKFSSDKRRLKTVQQNLAKQSESVVVDMVARAINSSDDVSAMLLLCNVTGFGPASASAILMATNPARYTVFDDNANHSLAALGLLQRHAEKGTWLNYLESCRTISRRTNESLRVVDRALYKAKGNASLPR